MTRWDREVVRYPARTRADGKRIKAYVQERPMRRRITTPSELPTDPPPPIVDSEEVRVHAAEDAIAGRFPKVGIEQARYLIRSAATGIGIAAPPVRQIDDYGWHVRAADDEITIGGSRWPTLDLLHAVAHLGVPTMFPAHGVEFVNSLRALVQRYEPPLAAPLDGALRDSRVTVDPMTRAANVRRRAIYVVGKEVGALVRVVLDGPPEEHVCQLLGVEPTGLVVRAACDPYALEMERLRYFTYRLSARIPRTPGAVGEWKR